MLSTVPLRPTPIASTIAAAAVPRAKKTARS